MRLSTWITAIFGVVAAAPVAAAENLQTVLAERVAMPLVYQVDGVVEARHRATLSAEVGGKVDAVYFDVDDYVEAGAVVLRIRDREFRARVQQASAALDEANANLQEAQLEFARNRDLLRQKLISQAVYDRANAVLKGAQARRAAAEANLAQAREQLGYTVLSAPYSGVVVQRHVEPGEALSPGQPIMTGYAPGLLRVSADVPQSMMAGLRRFRQARVVRIEDGSSLEVEKLTIHPFANARNHSFPIRLDLEPGSDLFPGMLVKVALAVGETELLLLPQQALVARAEVNAVYVVGADGRLGFRQVRPGNRHGERIEILAGLDPGERVALDPVRAGIAYKRQQEAAQ